MRRSKLHLFADSFWGFSLDIDLGQRVIALRDQVVANFDAGNWEEVGLLTGTIAKITSHPRLLRSLSWRDTDYPGHALTMLRQIVQRDPDRLLPLIENYVNEKFPGESTYISAKPSERRITFAPHVFAVPEGQVESDLVAVMMPFATEFDAVYETIKESARVCGLRCLRADDIWEDTTIVQDIFNLIFRARIIVVDFTGRNSNVMYETGIAHTLGKHVVPISQNLEHTPFDMQHHRVRKYLPNQQGLAQLSAALVRRLGQLTGNASTTTAAPDGTDWLNEPAGEPDWINS